MAKTIIGEGKHLRLVRDGRWEYAERTKAVGAVVLVAVTDAGELLLVEQHRAAVEANVLELPAGLVGDLDDADQDRSEGENREQQLLRYGRQELLEETGYEARDWQILTEGPPSAGLSNETVTFLRATGLVQRNAGGGTEEEGITVHRVPVDRVPAWLNEQRAAGRLIDPKIFAGLYFLKI